MCQNIYRKIFHKAAKNDNIPLYKCPVCAEEIYGGYDAYLMDEHYYDRKSCCYEALFLLAEEADCIDYCSIYEDEFQIFCTVKRGTVSQYSLYRRFCGEDKTQFGYWYALQNKIHIKLLRAGE